MATEPKARKPRHRSPAYPGVDLETAIERSKSLWEMMKRDSARPAAIASYWGYASSSSGARLVSSALRKYGLTEEEGTGPNRRIRLSDRAIRILLDDRDDSPEREDLIQDAALSPKIHADLYGRWPKNLPDNKHIRYFLTTERGFNDATVDDFIAQFRRTMAFAKLLGSDKEQDSLADTHPREEMQLSGSIAPTGPSQEESGTRDFRFSIALLGGRLASVTVPVPISKQNLERFLRMVDDQLEPFVESEDPKV